MRTNREWLDELPEPYKAEAYYLMSKDNPNFYVDLSLKEESLSEAIIKLFMWDDAEKWVSIFQSIQKGEKLVKKINKILIN